MPQRRIQVVLLDMGGVLIPEAPGYEGAVRDAHLLDSVRCAGIDDPRTFVIDTARRLRQSYRELEASATQPDVAKVLADVPDQLRNALLNAFRRQATRRAYTYARAVVAEIAREYRLGLVSNNVIPGDHHARALARAGILQHLTCAVWSANFGRRKPDPAIVLHVLEKLRTKPRNAIMVGDKLRTDILAAQRAGVRSIYLRKPGSPAVGEAKPDFVIRHLGALPALVRRLG